MWCWLFGMPFCFALFVKDAIELYHTDGDCLPDGLFFFVEIGGVVALILLFTAAWPLILTIRYRPILR